MGDNKTLICNVDMFAANQSVIYPDGRKNEVIADNLASMLPSLCQAGGYTKVHFFGNQSYIDGIITELRTVEALVCNNNHLEIEVN